MQKIIPNLWFNGNAREAVEYYVSVFADGKITGGSNYPASAEEGLADFQKDLAGKDLTVEFSLGGHEFVAINADGTFRPTSANSVMVNFDPSRDENARQHLDEIWQKLSDGGTALMPLQKYDFSEYYGWIQDKYGFSWQLILTNPNGEDRPYMIPSLQFGGSVQNRAKEAIEYYTSVFEGAKIGNQYPYGVQVGPATADSLMFADFTIAGQWFVANDSGEAHDFSFTEAVSYQVSCKDQAEIDYFWDKLSAVPESEQCGWCKDRFGVSWQIVPENMGELMQKPDAFKIMMKQHKIVIAEY